MRRSFETLLRIGQSLICFPFQEAKPMTAVRTTRSIVLSLFIIIAAASVAAAQLQPPEVRGLRGAPFPSMNPPPDVRSFGEGPQWDGKPPDGIQPLAVDMFTSKD